MNKMLLFFIIFCSYASASDSNIPLPSPLLSLQTSRSSAQLSLAGSLDHSPLSDGEQEAVDADPVLFDTVNQELENPQMMIAQYHEEISSSQERSCKRLWYCISGIMLASLVLTVVEVSNGHHFDPPANNSTANATLPVNPTSHSVVLAQSHYQPPLHYSVLNPIKNRKARKKSFIHQPQQRRGKK